MQPLAEEVHKQILAYHESLHGGRTLKWTLFQVGEVEGREYVYALEPLEERYKSLGHHVLTLPALGTCYLGGEGPLEEEGAAGVALLEVRARVTPAASRSGALFSPPKRARNSI